MPARAPKTRAQLLANATQRITDPQNQQNTARTLREVLEEERFSSFNRAEDNLTAEEIVGLDALLQNSLLINRIRGGPKAVQTLAQRDALVVRGVIALGSQVYVGNPATTAGAVLPAKVYVAARNDDPDDLAASFICYVDGGETNDTARAEWVEQGTAAATVAVLPYFDPLGLPPNGSYPQGFTLKYSVNGTLQGFTTKQELTAADFGGAIPAPTGAPDDPNYDFFSPPGIAYQLRQNITVPGARTLQAASEIGGHLYRLYRYLEQEDNGGGLAQAPPRAEYDVLLWGLTPQSFSESLAWQIDNSTNTVSAVGSYDLAEDVFTAGSGSTYWGALAQSANDATTIPAYVTQRLLSYVLSTDTRLNDARRAITARTTLGDFYTGPDGDIVAASAFAGVAGVITLQQAYLMPASLTLPIVCTLQGTHRYTQLALDNYRITLLANCNLSNLNIYYGPGQTGDIFSAVTANSRLFMPRLIDCILSVCVSVAAGGFLYLLNCDIAGSDWNKGAGTIILENCREFGTRGTGPGFATVIVVGDETAPSSALSFVGEITHTAAVTLTSADLNKAHTLDSTNPAAFTLTLPANPGAAKAALRVRVVPTATGVFVLDGNGNLIDGEATRRLWAGESRELLWTGTAWAKTDNGVVKPMRAKIQGDGSGNYAVATQSLITLPLPVVTNRSVAAMTATANTLLVPRTGTYAVSGSSMALLTAACLEFNLILTLNGQFAEPRARTAILSSPGFGGPVYTLQPNPTRTIELVAGDALTITQYSEAAYTIDNRSAAPSYIGELEIIEQPTW